MPYELTLGSPPAGYAMHNASGVEGNLAVIAVREFTSSEDGELFISRLEGFPSELIAKLPADARIFPSTVDHLIAVIRPDLRTTLYVNECPIRMRARMARRIEAGEAVYERDIVDIDALEFEGVDLPGDAAVLCVFSAGWRKGMFFDFTPLNPDAPTRDYDFGKLLGSYYAYLKSQRVFSLEEDDWSFLLQRGWFPFVTLPAAVKGKIVGFAKDREDLDRLIPEVVAEVERLLPTMLARWSESKLFEPHIELIRHAAEEFNEADYVSSTALLYPRIEGLLRTLHEALGISEKASQEVLTAAAVDARANEFHQYSWLLPEMFRRYMNEVYFAVFEPGKPATLSRNSVGHGVASAEDFNMKGAVIGLLILDQLFYFLPLADGEAAAG